MDKFVIKKIKLVPIRVMLWFCGRCLTHIFFAKNNVVCFIPSSHPQFFQQLDICSKVLRCTYREVTNSFYWIIDIFSSLRPRYVNGFKIKKGVWHFSAEMIWTLNRPTRDKTTKILLRRIREECKWGSVSGASTPISKNNSGRKN